MATAQTQVTLPTDLVDRLTAAGKAMGLGLPAYLLFLEMCQAGKLDEDAQDAVRFMFSTQGASLKKLAE